MQAATTSGLAVASLVLGIVWLWWLGSILALVFGRGLGPDRLCGASVPQAVLDGRQAPQDLVEAIVVLRFVRVLPLEEEGGHVGGEDTEEGNAGDHQQGADATAPQR